MSTQSRRAPASESRKRELESELDPESLSFLELPPHMEVIYCTTASQCDAALKRVPDHSVWGFDIEWKVTYIKGESTRPAALLQLSSDLLVILLHLHVHGITPSLGQLLANPHVRKVGVNVVGDCRKLERDFPQQVRVLCTVYCVLCTLCSIMCSVYCLPYTVYSILPSHPPHPSHFVPYLPYLAGAGSPGCLRAYQDVSRAGG
jgi:hypothetical protein